MSRITAFKSIEISPNSGKMVFYVEKYRTLNMFLFHVKQSLTLAGTIFWCVPLVFNFSFEKFSSDV